MYNSESYFLPAVSMVWKKKKLDLLAKRFSNLEALYGASIDSLMSYNLLNEAVAVNTYSFLPSSAQCVGS